MECTLTAVTGIEWGGVEASRPFGLKGLWAKGLGDERVWAPGLL